MFLRYAIEWKGKVIWHTDSQAVIDTYNGKLNHLTPGKWAVQRDKDIFDAMLYQKTWWKDRFQLEKVESHVDKKKDEYGNKRIPTPIEHMNIYADCGWQKVHTTKKSQSSTPAYYKERTNGQSTKWSKDNR